MTRQLCGRLHIPDHVGAVAESQVHVPRRDVVETFRLFLQMQSPEDATGEVRGEQDRGVQRSIEERRASIR